MYAQHDIYISTICYFIEFTYAQNVYMVEFTNTQNVYMVEFTNTQNVFWWSLPMHKM